MEVIEIAPGAGVEVVDDEDVVAAARAAGG